MRLEPLQPGAAIGILGGGQLGRLLAMAAAKLGFKAYVYAPEEDSPAFQVASVAWRHSYDDERALREFSRACGVITFEFENVPAEALELAAQLTRVHPPARAARTTQDRIAEKRFLSELGLPTAPHTIIETEKGLSSARAFLEARGAAILKRAREGYDGKGQSRVATGAELETAFQELAGACVLEAVVDFEIEISVIGVRSAEGETACYDSPENEHDRGILSRSVVPASSSANAQALAREMTETIAAALDYCGVLGVEFFVMPSGAAPSLLVNEIAPRVHNSGHWTLEACPISQFENHIRAIAGWPIGSVERHSDAVMNNLIGEEVLRWKDYVTANPSASLHLYGKSNVREGRKLGHVTQITPLKNK